MFTTKKTNKNNRTAPPTTKANKPCPCCKEPILLATFLDGRSEKETSTCTWCSQTVCIACVYEGDGDRCICCACHKKNKRDLTVIHCYYCGSQIWDKESIDDQSTYLELHEDKYLCWDHLHY